MLMSGVVVFGILGSALRVFGANGWVYSQVFGHRAAGNSACCPFETQDPRL